MQMLQQSGRWHSQQQEKENDLARIQKAIMLVAKQPLEPASITGCHDGLLRGKESGLLKNHQCPKWGMALNKKACPVSLLAPFDPYPFGKSDHIRVELQRLLAIDLDTLYTISIFL